MFILVLIFTLVLIFGTYVVAWLSRPNYFMASLLAGVIGVAPGLCLLYAPALWFMVGAVALVGLFCQWYQPRPRVFFVGAAAASLISLVGVVFYDHSDLGEIGKRKKEYPIEDMGERLAYEKKYVTEAQGGERHFSLSHVEIFEEYINTE